jgi:hypothetical protein
MTCVVQPNVITPDQKAGGRWRVVLVTETAFERRIAQSAGFSGSADRGQEP